MLRCTLLFRSEWSVLIPLLDLIGPEVSPLRDLVFFFGSATHHARVFAALRYILLRK
jgi:hypothetical protein